MEPRKIELPAKPGAQLAAAAYLPAPEKAGTLFNTLVVFLNGLGLPQSSWVPAIQQLLEERSAAGKPVPAILTYDRYGQGESDPDPTDPPETPYGHTPDAVVADLHVVLTQFVRDELRSDLGRTRLVFVCGSIGCPLSRLYSAAHREGEGGSAQAAAYLWLDSMVANTDFVSFLPDVDAPGFDASSLPAGVDVDELRRSREAVRRTFYPTVPNKERLDRRHMADLLPHADEPKLPPGPGGAAPKLVVIGHGYDEFAKQNLEGPMAIPLAITHAYINSGWNDYNIGLTKLSTNSEGPRQAEKSGHFVQRDQPEIVVKELGAILDYLS